jgi:hypothetical protein
MKYLISICLVLFSWGTLYSQSLAGGVNPDSNPAVLPDSSVSDTTTHRAKPKLLPGDISWMERFLWGEDGLVRKVGIAGPLTPETRKGELQVRRTMLTAHQIGGFVTLGLLVGAVYFGQRTLDGGDRTIKNDHVMFVTAAVISYSLTGGLAILSPPPLIRRSETSTTTIHKTLAWVHFVGMVVTPILGSMIGRRYPNDTSRIHQISGYITTSTLALSMIVVTL